MDDGERQRRADRDQINELLRLERYLRDQGAWTELADCYTEDSRVRTTWFDGTGPEFARASQEMAEQRGRHSRHFITPMRVRVEGDRALTESYGEIHNRSTIDGTEVDMIQYCRFVSRVVRTERGWRLASFDGIYGKDQIWTVDPARELPFDFAELDGLRPSYRVWAYTLGLKGYEVGSDELGDDRPDLLETFFAEAQEWLGARELVA